MSKVSCLALAVLVIVSAPSVAQDHELWIAAAAHAAGVGTSVWRTDLSVLNPCQVEATVEIALVTAAGTQSASFTVAAGRQQVFADVVAQLTTGDATGCLRIVSDQEVTVRSRTYNLTADGTYGQSLDAVVERDGIDAGDTGYLQQLQETADFRSNVGVLNMGDAEASVTITLYDTAGSEVGSFTLTVPAGQARQDNAPYARRFGRSDVAAGWATVTVDLGADVWAYASVVDNRTDDPTTVPLAEWDGECDFSQALARFFSLEAVHQIAITVDQSGVDALLAEPFEYVHAGLTIDDRSFADVGVRLKGGAGSFIPLDGDYPPISGDGNCNPGKSAFIVDLNRYVAGTNFLGLEKLTLNNMVQDDSGIHEYLGYALFREAGVPASQVGYATVSFNGVVKGLYLTLESTDNDVFLERWFGSDQGNLYEGEYGTDLVAEQVEWFDQDNGDDQSKQDLVELVAALDAVGEGEDPLPVLDQHLNMDAYLSFASTELFLGHWDGYAWSANNYKLHHLPDESPWTFIPWGADQLFEDWLEPHGGVMQGPGPSWHHGGRIHRLCFASSACRTRLSQAFTDLLARVEGMDLAGLADQARQLVEPLLVAEATAHGDPDITRAALDGVSDYIAGRPASVEAWLPCLTGGSVDNDGDTFDGCSADCDDRSPEVHPGASETCNLLDDDCNGVFDDPPQCPRCLDESGSGGVAFALCFDRKPWPEARQYCQSRGQELASIHDAETWQSLGHATLERIHAPVAWIGLNDRETEAIFRWSDGTELDFVAWTSDSPKPWGDDLDCVSNAYWGWSDTVCDEPLPFVCKTP